MDLISLQINNEYAYCKKHTVETVKQSLTQYKFDEYVEHFAQDLREYFSVDDFEYTLKDGTKKIYLTKARRYGDMQRMSDGDLLELAWKTVIHSVLQRTTLTSVVAKIQNDLPHEDRLALETASEIIGVLATTPFIDVEYPRNTDEGVLMIQPKIKPLESLTDYVDNLRYVLPSLVTPKALESNTCSGYLTFNDTVFTKKNHHDEYVNLHHLNRQNSIALCIDERVYRLTEPVFKEDPKESPDEHTKRVKAFRKLNHECIDIYKKFIATPFYLTHRYDSRLRTYTKGYHLTSQGADYQKGGIELAEPELILG